MRDSPILSKLYIKVSVKRDDKLKGEGDKDGSTASRETKGGPSRERWHLIVRREGKGGRERGELCTNRIEVVEEQEDASTYKNSFFFRKI